MARILIWLLAAILVIAVTVLVALPAAWMAPLLERQTGGRLTLGEAQGSLWNGSAFIGAAADREQPVVPLLPGRFQWQLSPSVLLGRVDLQLENRESLAQPLRVTGGWYQWQISPSSVMLPAQRLAALGAPLNTIQPSGRMRLAWGVLRLGRLQQTLNVVGLMTLEMDEIASRLSPVQPLGAYTMTFDWQGQQADIRLKTRNGPLLLNGSGVLANGRLQFSGRAEAAEAEQHRLANLLNLLGQRRSEGGKDFIALEFK